MHFLTTAIYVWSDSYTLLFSLHNQNKTYDRHFHPSPNISLINSYRKHIPDIQTSQHSRIYCDPHKGGGRMLRAQNKNMQVLPCTQDISKTNDRFLVVHTSPHYAQKKKKSFSTVNKKTYNTRIKDRNILHQLLLCLIILCFGNPGTARFLKTKIFVNMSQYLKLFL